MIAGAIGAFVAYYVAYHSTIGFLWPSTFGLAATLASGLAIAVVWPAAPDDPGRDLTWWSVIQRGGLQ
jgi:hypothetical protein